jgi:hypothetical protein
VLDKLTYLETPETRYPMAFTFNVMEAIQDKYGTIENWSKLIQSKQEPNISALKFFLTEAINEGLDIEGQKNVLTTKQIGRILTQAGIQNASKAIQDLVTKSVPESNDSKNAVST